MRTSSKQESINPIIQVTNIQQSNKQANWSPQTTAVAAENTLQWQLSALDKYICVYWKIDGKLLCSVCGIQIRMRRLQETSWWPTWGSSFSHQHSSIPPNIPIHNLSSRLLKLPIDSALITCLLSLFQPFTTLLVNQFLPTSLLNLSFIACIHCPVSCSGYQFLSPDQCFPC